MDDVEFGKIDWAALSPEEFLEKADDLSISQRRKAMALRQGTTVGGSKKVAVVVSPDFTEGDVSFIAGMPADDIFAHDPHGRRVPSPKYSAEDWLLYFWQEAKEGWGGGDAPLKSKVRDFFNQGFIKPADFKQSRKIICKGPLLDHFSPIQLRDAMDAMLKIGFECFDYVETNAPDNMRRYRLRDDKRYEILIFWRSEDFRDLDYLRRHGYQKQCNDTSPPLDSKAKVRCEAINCTADWHPFKLVENQRRMWYRKGHSDNCWYTVVSVAESWKTAVCYPKFGQTAWMQIGPEVKALGLDLAERRYPKMIGKVKFKSGGVARKMITFCNVVLVLVDTEVFNTHKRQSEGGTGYDEKGVSSIAGKNVVGMVRFLRIHHGFTDEEGLTAYPLKSESRMEQASGLVEAFGELGTAIDFNSRLLGVFSQTINSPPVAVRWDETGWKEVPKLKYLGVYEPVVQVDVDGKTYRF